MFPEKKPSNFLTPQEQGLGKSQFWDGVGRFFAGIAGAILESAGGPIGKYINNHLNAWLYAGADVFKTGDSFEPSPAEQAILEPWNKTKISPFVAKIAKELDVAFKAATIEEQISKINKVVSKICYVKQYYISKETAGLSIQAIQWRKDFVYLLVDPLLELIATTTANKPVSNKNMMNTGVNTTINDYFGLIPTANFTNNYTCNHYKVNPGVIEMPVMEPIGTDPIDGTLVVVPTTPTDSETTPPGSATEKTFLQKNGVWLAVAVVAAWALKPKKKKSKSK